MHVELKATYKATYRKRPAIKYAEGFLSGTFQVAIEEAPPADAPTVARFDYEDEKQSRPGPARAVELKFYNGRHLYSTDLDAARLRSAIADPALRAGTPLQGEFDRYKAPREDEPGVQVESGWRERAEVSVQRMADAIVLVDGRVWVAGPEPVVKVEVVAGDGGEIFVKARVYRDVGDNPQSTYRLDQAEQGVSDLVDKIAAVGEYPVHATRIEVIDASAFSRPVEHALLAHAGGNFLAAMRKVALDRPENYLVAYARLRDAHSVFCRRVEAEGAPDGAAYSDALTLAVEVHEASMGEELTGAARDALKRFAALDEAPALSFE